jgi:hypothetical protein
MTTHISKVAIEVFEVIRGNKYEQVIRENKCERKDTWWWDKNIQKIINKKKEYYKCLHYHKNNKNI